jgi:ABC-type antimicrobial peptide transport system permease subunit
VLRVLPLTLQVNGNFRIERLLSRLITLYGSLALALALLGLYGVTAYGVSQRRREIGVRMALGADGGDVVRTCVRGPLVQTASGLVLGLIGSVFVGQAIRSQLFGVDAFDASSWGIAVVALVVSAVIAAALPARRAASVSPSVVLRGE